MAKFVRRRKFCRFTAEGATEIDYKDLDTLKGYVSESVNCLKLLSARVTLRCYHTQTATSNFRNSVCVP